MTKTLNPHASGGEGHRPPASDPSPHDTPRRNVLAASLAAVVGALVAIFPFAPGLLVFFDPLLRGKKTAGESGEEDEAKGPLLRVATLDALPTDGTPVQVPVLSDKTNAWNREANQPVGAVYLRRVGNNVECFNAICPHAGCFIGYSGDRKLFQCPCHTSSFQLDGERIMPSPSPRDMDELTVDPEKLRDGEVWVEFVNYYPGTEHREPKP